MYTLYIDTHYINLEIALIKDNKIITHKIIESNKHSEYTINLLKKVLEDNNLKIDNIEEIIVINGPGSFTGVRIGVVIAKIIGYTKKINIKPISYLEALSLNYNQDIILGISDKNGVFIGNFNKNHELKEDYFYLSNEELKKYPNDIKLDEKVDIMKIYTYLKDKESINPHFLKPLYIKKIEVQKC